MPAEHKSENLYRQHLPNGLSFDLIHVKGGSYFFGHSNHKITLPDFCIGKYPVTQALWQAVMGDNPAYFKGKNRPIECVSWYGAAAFCNALNALAGYAPVYFRDKQFQKPLDYGMTLLLVKPGDNIDVHNNFQSTGFRLPSETEWEYSARGGAKSDTFEYAGSEKLDEVGWYNDNSQLETKPVGLKAPNELHIHDMSGNVWEWCADQWHDYSKLINIPKDGSAWVNRFNGAYRVFHGGGWLFSARYCRPSNRDDNTPSFRSNNLGFRIASSPQVLIF